MVCKRCFYWKCKSDSRYHGKPYMKDIFFIKFPHPVKDKEKYEDWMKLCGREIELDDKFHQDSSTQYKAWRNGSRFVCSNHFEGGKGPKGEDDNPIASDVQGYKLRKPIEVIPDLKNVNNATSGRLSPAENVDNNLNNSEIVSDKPENIQPVLVFVQQNTGKTIIKFQDKSKPIMKSIPEKKPISKQVEHSRSILRPKLPSKSVAAAVESDTSDTPKTNFTKLVRSLDLAFTEPGWFLTSKTDKEIAFSKIKNNSLVLNVTVGQDLVPTISVYGKKLDPKHKVFETLRYKINTMKCLKLYLKQLGQWHLCVGNHEEVFVKLLKSKLTLGGYYETMNNAIHSVNCSKLTETRRARCINCQKYRSCLRKKISVLKARESTRDKDRGAQQRICKLKKRMLKLPKIDGEIKKTFGAKFIEEQIRMLNATSKFGRRWSLDVINWCATMEAAFPKAYQFLKVSGALKLPEKATIRKSLEQQFGKNAQKGATLAKTVREEVSPLEQEAGGTVTREEEFHDEIQPEFEDNGNAKPVMKEDEIVQQEPKNTDASQQYEFAIMGQEVAVETEETFSKAFDQEMM